MITLIRFLQCPTDGQSLLHTLQIPVTEIIIIVVQDNVNNTDNLRTTVATVDEAATDNKNKAHKARILLRKQTTRQG